MDASLFSALKEKSIHWRYDKPRDRIQRLQKVKYWIKKNEISILLALTEDFKKPDFETKLSEIIPTLSEIDFICENLRCWMEDKNVPTPMTLLGHRSRIRVENKGVVLVIAPWNYPFSFAVIPLITALAAGNPVVLKPSELTPRTSDLLKLMVTDCFLPDEVIVELGAKEKNEELLSYHFDHVFFTGSTAVGKVIARACADRLIPMTLELGGKSPTIIDDSADLKMASEKIFWGKFLNRGQTCVAPDYLIAHDKIAKELADRLQALAILHQSDEQGEIISKRHSDRLNRLAQTESTQTLTLVHQPELSTPVMQEEIFGPVLPILVYKTEAELIGIVRKYEKPLALYIFSEDNSFVERIIKELPSGGVGINSVLVHLANHHLPFGGIRPSGQGRYHGYFGFLELSHQRAIIEQSFFTFLRKLVQPPYTPFKKTLLKYL